MKVTKDMTIGDVLMKNPKAARILMGFDLGCVGCPASQSETLEEASNVHGLKVEDLLEALNKE